MLEVDVEMVIKVGDWVMSAVLELAELEALQVTEEREAEVVVEAAVASTPDAARSTARQTARCAPQTHSSE